MLTLLIIAILWLLSGYAGWRVGCAVFIRDGLDIPYDLYYTIFFGPLNLIATTIIYFQYMKPSNKS